MKLYAIAIKPRALPLIALLNNGVTPEIEKKPTYFIFDADPDTEFVPQIITLREFIRDHDIYAHSPSVLALKK